MAKKKKRRRKQLLAEKLEHVAIKLGKIYALLMTTRYREKSKPSVRIYSRHRKHKKQEQE